MEEPFTFQPLNLDAFDQTHDHQDWNPDDISNQYNFLESSLNVGGDVKIQNLEEDVISQASSSSRRTAPLINNKSNFNYTVNHLNANASSDVKETRSRKKRKKNQEDEVTNITTVDESGDVSLVKLSREQLLVMSSNELEERVKYLQSQRSLTVAEHEEIKRQRKLIKNREYAQTSRLKKRETLSTLKCKLGEVTIENEILKTQVSHLSQRVQYLEQENNQLRSFLTVNPPLHTIVPSSPALKNFPLTRGEVQPNPMMYAHPSSGHLNQVVGMPAPLPPSPEYSEVGSPSVSTDEYEQFFTSDSDDTLAFEVASMNDMENQGLTQFTGNIFPNVPGMSSSLSPGMWVGESYTRGLCLLVILFSFGLFFSGIPGTSLPLSHSTGRTLSSTEYEDLLGTAPMRASLTTEDCFPTEKGEAWILKNMTSNDKYAFSNNGKFCVGYEPATTTSGAFDSRSDVKVATTHHHLNN